MIWFAVIAGSVGCYLAKLSGYLVPARIFDSESARRVTYMIPVAMLGALIAVQTFASGQQLVIDARLAGLLAAIVALLLRAPFLVVVVVAAAAAALLRATGLGS